MRPSFWVVCLFFICASVLPVRADITKTLNFDVDGVLPSSEPDIVYVDQFGDPDNELKFSVSGGLLIGDNITGLPPDAYPGVEFGYAYPNGFSSGGMVSDVFYIETRARLGSTGTGIAEPRYCQLIVYTGYHNYSIYYTRVSLRFSHAGGYTEVPIDVHQFHTLRLEGKGAGLFDVYVDGSLLASDQIANAGPVWRSGFQFLLSAPITAAYAEWDYVDFWAVPGIVATETNSWGEIKSLFQ